MRSAVEVVIQMTLRVHLIYNPYSIVKERWIAKIGVEHNALSRLVLTADARGSLSLFVLRGRGRHLESDGGADRDRTDDPLLAKQMLSQLSYSPGRRLVGNPVD